MFVRIYIPSPSGWVGSEVGENSEEAVVVDDEEIAASSGVSPCCLALSLLLLLLNLTFLPWSLEPSDFDVFDSLLGHCFINSFDNGK